MMSCTCGFKLSLTVSVRVWLCYRSAMSLPNVPYPPKITTLCEYDLLRRLAVPKDREECKNIPKIFRVNAN
jgi:hypothetical protein